MEILVLLFIPVGIIYLIISLLSRKRSNVTEVVRFLDSTFQIRLATIPELLQVSKRFMDYDHELIKEIIQLREQAMKRYNTVETQKGSDELAQFFVLQKQLGQKVMQLFHQIENYPELRDDVMLGFVKESYDENEEFLQEAIRFYNNGVKDLNNFLKIFPNQFIANLMHIEPLPEFSHQVQV